MCLAGAWRWAFGARRAPSVDTEAQSGTNRTEREHTPPGNIVKSSRQKPAIRRRPSRQVHELVVQLIEQIVDHYDKLCAFRVQLESSRERSTYHQEELDRRSNAISRLSGDRRANLEAAIAKLNNELEHHQAERLAGGKDIRSLHRQILELDEILAPMWKRLSDSAQVYVDECFEADFQAPWAMTERCCGNLMRWSHQYEQFRHSRKQQLDLEVQRVLDRVRRRQAGLEPSGGFTANSRYGAHESGGVTRTDETHGRSMDVDLTVELRTEIVKGLEVGLIKESLRPFVESQKVLGRETPWSRRSSPRKSSLSGVSPDGSLRSIRSRSKYSNSSRQRSAGDASPDQTNPGLSQAALISNYLDWRRQADEELQYLCEFDLDRREGLAEHLLVFTNTSPEWFVHKRDKVLLQQQLERYRAVQQVLMNATQALVNSGIGFQFRVNVRQAQKAGHSWHGATIANVLHLITMNLRCLTVLHAKGLLAIA